MKRLFIIMICFIGFQTLQAQSNSINFIDLPDVFNTELEISGMVGHKDTLYLVSEREKIIFLVNAHNYSIITSISLTDAITKYNSLNQENEINIRDIEMEGVTWYKSRLLLVDEGNTAIYQYDLINGTIFKLKTNLDLSEFHGSLGMEGIAVNPDKGLVYILRERNGKNQTEIYTLKISKDNFLTYDQQKYIINHENNDWRYSDIYYDKAEDILYGLRSYYNKNNPENAECFVDKIPVNKQGFPNEEPVYNNDKTLSRSVINNRCRYVSNLEGLYKAGKTIYLVSDNQRSTKKCDARPIKTMFIEYIPKI